MASSISAIANLATAGSAVLSGAVVPSASQQAAPPFSDLIEDAVGGMDALQAQAQSAVTGLMTGNGVDVHTAMIATEKASMAFELSLAVRNKAVQAYQQVMSMQF